MAATATASSVGPRYAPPDPSLPKPWRGLVDGKTGYLYFWNPETNVTQYERPSSSAAPPKSSSVPSSSVQVQQTSQRQRSRSPCLNDRYDRNGRGGSSEDGLRNQQSSKGGSSVLIMFQMERLLLEMIVLLQEVMGHQMLELDYLQNLIGVGMKYLLMEIMYHRLLHHLDLLDCHLRF